MLTRGEKDRKRSRVEGFVVWTYRNAKEVNAVRYESGQSSETVCLAHSAHLPGMFKGKSEGMPSRASADFKAFNTIFYPYKLS